MDKMGHPKNRRMRSIEVIAFDNIQKKINYIWKSEG